jgi:pyruvate formate lyase activating enzyme
LVVEHVSKQHQAAPSIRRSTFYEKLEGDRVQCGVCERRCRLQVGQDGFCKTKRNMNGDLYTLVYGDISSISANPIEKKPFFHFWPGSYALTVGTWSCNFPCPWCQNWEISKYPPDPRKAKLTAPEELLNIALNEKCRGVSISFNEPTLLLEYSLDLFPLARRNALYSTYVSNGYMTLEALNALHKAGMDAIKFDVKGTAEVYREYCGADANVVWRNIAESRRLGVHVEVVTLLIPGVNDSDSQIEEISERHLKAAGPETPLHFTRFHPNYKMTDRPATPITTLEGAHRIAKSKGLLYVYIGNVPGHRLENTYCHKCGALLIQRCGFAVVKYAVSHDKRCPRCKEAIPIVGHYVD